MADPLDTLEALVQTLKQQRDELQVRMHLAQAEAKEEWEAMERKWDELDAKLRAARREANASAGDVWTAAGLLSDEIGKAYQRILKSFR